MIPEGPYLRFHLVEMDWFKLWQAYASSPDNNQPPGQINNFDNIKHLLITKDILIHSDNWMGNYHFKDSAKEDVHFKVLDD